MANYLGIDIGGTKVKLGVVDGNKKEIIEEMSVVTRTSDGTEAILDDITAAAKQLMLRNDVERIGIGSAGRIDRRNGIVITAGNLPFRNAPVAEELSRRLGKPAMLDNDGNCAVIGEYLAGIAVGRKDVVMLVVGTGIGGGVICGGRLLTGRNGRAGELGHTVIDIHSQTPCPCGLRGCFEQYCSAKALTARTKAECELQPESILAHTAGRIGIDGSTAFRAADAGCPVAESLLEEYFTDFALAVNSYVKIFMPELVVIAGGITNEGDGFLSRLGKHLLPEADVRISPLKSYCGLFGAALQHLMPQ